MKPGASTRLVSAPGEPLRGIAELPGDKSLSHRLALLAAIAEGESRVENFLHAGVTEVMLRALTALGVEWALEGSTLTVHGSGLGGLNSPGDPIDCGNSATTLRLLAGILAAAGIPAELDGSPGLRRRPMGRIVEPLRRMGVPVEAAPGGRAPLKFSARHPDQPLEPLDYALPVSSAQVKSCLLLAGLAAGGPTRLREPSPSRDHTERLFSGLGVQIERYSLTEAGEFQEAPLDLPGALIFGRPVSLTLDPPRPLSLPAMRFRIPGDISSAAFLIVAALITPGSEITLRGIGLNPTRTGLLEALASMGADLQVVEQAEAHGEPYGDLRVRASQMRSTRIDGPLVVRMIDEFPALAVAAALAHGKTVVRGAGELRHKESDRIAALCAELNRLGVEVHASEDGFEIQGGRRLHPATVDAHGDHRLAMALAVAGLAAGGPVVVHGAESIQESFPGFVPTLNGLGAQLAYEMG